MKSIFVIAIVASSFIGCGSYEKTAETKETGHDSHASTATSVNMPPMPEVPSNAKVFFSNLKDGQTVTSPLKVEMGIEAMSVDTANGILKPASGHHHILVDMDSIQTGEVIKKDSVHIHFGNAQTSAEIKLPPGKHSLTLQFADAMHRSYGSRLTSKITVDVKQ
jgi:hypothetical protein